MNGRRALLAAAVAMAACGGSGDAPNGQEGPVVFPGDAFVVFASTDVAVGTNRLLASVSLADGTRLGGPDVPVTFEMESVDSSMTVTAPASWVWIVPDVVGMYRADATLPVAGEWSLKVVGSETPPPVPFLVADKSSSPSVGDLVPLIDTPTLADHSVAALTTDRDPDLAFYQTSLRDAIEAGEVTVVVFSTPAYCRTAACGPLLDIVKEAAPSFPDVTFIHVEVFVGLDDPNFSEEGAQLAPAVGPDGFNLPSEPWVFVIDSSGIVTDRFEGVIDRLELDAALG